MHQTVMYLFLMGLCLLMSVSLIVAGYYLIAMGFNIKFDDFREPKEDGDDVRSI